MKTNKKDLYNEVKRINSPYDNIGNQLQRDTRLVQLLKENAQLTEYDLYKMIPKVSYDDWVVCLYEEDNKFYYIDEELVTEVIPTMVLHPDEKYKTYFTEDGKAIHDLEDLALHLNLEYFCCGEGDDMQSYIVFNDVK